MVPVYLILLCSVLSSASQPQLSLSSKPDWSNGSGFGGGIKLTISPLNGFQVTGGWTLSFRLGTDVSITQLWDGKVDSCPSSICTVSVSFTYLLPYPLARSYISTILSRTWTTIPTYTQDRASLLGSTTTVRLWPCLEDLMPLLQRLALSTP
jgi:hypothetical protein